MSTEPDAQLSGRRAMFATWAEGGGPTPNASLHTRWLYAMWKRGIVDRATMRMPPDIAQLLRDTAGL